VAVKGTAFTVSLQRYKSSRATVFAEFSGLHRARITVALMVVAERRLRLLDVTGPG
jgi:hypothetical protein